MCVLIPSCSIYEHMFNILLILFGKKNTHTHTRCAAQTAGKITESLKIESNLQIMPSTTVHPSSHPPSSWHQDQRKSNKLLSVVRSFVWISVFSRIFESPYYNNSSVLSVKMETVIPPTLSAS